MKIALILLGLLVPGVYCASASPPRTPEEFIAACRAAYEDKSGDKLKALTYTVGMSEQDQAMMFEIEDYIFADQQVDRITLEPLPADYQDEVIVYGMKFESTSPPVGFIKTHYLKSEIQDDVGGLNHSLMPYTVVDEAYYLVGTKSSDLGWEGPPDKNIGFAVRGTILGQIKVLLKWNASGIDRESYYSFADSRAADESGYSSNSAVVLGQHIDQVIVTSLDDKADITLEILEEGESVFTSEPLKGRGTIRYQR